MTESISRRHVFTGLAAVTAGSVSANMAQSQGFSEALEVMSDPEALEVLRRWRGHLEFTIGDDGQMLAGWGYAQTVPELSSEIQEQLFMRTPNLRGVVEALETEQPTQLPAR